MRLPYLLPLLALFVVPLGLRAVSSDLASHSLPSLSTREIRNVPDSAPSRVSSSTAEAKPRKQSSLAQVAAALPAAASAAPVSPPATTTTAVTAPAPSDDFAAQVEAEVLRLSNEERIKEGLAELAPDTKLRQIAWLHSADMIANDYFNHEDAAGCSSSCRVTNAGYRWRAVGENIYMMSGYKLSAEKTAAMIVDGWMNSPGHKANILGGSFTVSGIGVVSDGKSVYITAEYAKPR
jgi:uncharacterized protein YkwD